MTNPTESFDSHHPPAEVLASELACDWWADCFPQWQGPQHD